MNILELLGFGKKRRLMTELMKDGAIVIDVREPSEFERGHVEGSVNIPLGQIQGKAKSIKNKYGKVITCCRSGMRSQSACNILKSAGIEAVNGGSWQQVRSYKEH
jgi:rhodanese-related sulfurtransferase